MKKFKLWTVLSHINVVLCGMFLTFFVIDRINPAMNFLGSELSKWLLLCFAILAMAEAIVAIAYIRRYERHEFDETRERRRREIMSDMNSTSQAAPSVDTRRYGVIVKNGSDADKDNKELQKNE